MKIFPALFAAFVFSLAAMTLNQTALAHCEVPCGIYDDQRRFEDMLEDQETIAKGMGGGMPIGAFISKKEIMNKLTHHPVLGHITTFGGNAVSCAASLACLKEIKEKNLSHTLINRNILKSIA